MKRSIGVVGMPLMLALLACKAASGGSASTRGSPGTLPTDANESATRTADDSVPVSAGASASSGTVPVSVIEGRSGVENGFLHITGLIKNDSTRWINFARVDIQLFDAEGKPIGVDSIAAAEGHGESTYAIRDNTPPGESNPFHYLRDIKKLARPYASHKLTARALYSDGKTHATVEGVKIDKESVGKIEYLRVTGTIRNTGGECRYPKAVLAYYDAAGKLYAAREGVDQWDVKTPFSPGATAAFTTGPFDTQGIVKDVKVWGDCRTP